MERKNMWHRLIVAIGAVVTVLNAQGPSAAARVQAAQDHLRQTVELQSGTVVEAFSYTLKSTGKPGGMIMLSACGDADRSPLRLPADSSLAGGLDMIAAVFPAYYWTVQDGGAINLLPKQGMPPALDFRIPQFDWETAASANLTVHRLFQTKGLDGHLAKLGIVTAVESGLWLQKAPRVVNGVPETPRQGKEYRVENLTLFEVLNAIAISYGDGSWVYEEQSCRGEKSYRISARSSM